MKRGQDHSSKPTFGGKVIGQAIALLVFVGMPVFVTAMVPVSWIKWQRTGDRVVARAQTCLLFVIPYRTVVIDPVTGVSQRSVSGTKSRVRERRGTDEYVTSENQGWIAIEGPNQSVEIQVSPHDLQSVLKEAESFLKGSGDTELKRFVAANWKFGVIGGGLVSLLTVIYVLAIVAGFFMWVLVRMGLLNPRVLKPQQGYLP